MHDTSDVLRVSTLQMFRLPEVCADSFYYTSGVHACTHINKHKHAKDTLEQWQSLQPGNL